MKITATNSTPTAFNGFWSSVMKPIFQPQEQPVTEPKPRRKQKEEPSFYNDPTPCVVSCSLNTDGLRILPVAQEIIRTGAIVNAQKYMDNIEKMEANFRYIRGISKETDGDTKIRKAEYALDGQRYVLKSTLTEKEEDEPSNTLYTFNADVFDEENNHFCSYEKIKKGGQVSSAFVFEDAKYGNITLNSDPTTGRTYFSVTNAEKEYRLKGHFTDDPDALKYTQVEKYTAPQKAPAAV